ncbi:TetR/AcrR family transcriptional regulator [Aeromicrobium panaciterrae]|uniref:TetR/AcrR family transcriptional regulator n=1 Tax=Aeromicrobium panaciterrae TaxID=363861 RepID=UPI0031D95FB8
MHDPATTDANMRSMAEEPMPSGIPERLIEATISLLASEGPSAIKARTVAAEAGMSTMVVYSHFGGIPELLRATVDYGFDEMRRGFEEAENTNDPIADLFGMALAARAMARANPHLYDAMFGLSNRATYRPTRGKPEVLSGHSPAFQSAYAHLTGACERLAASGRVADIDPVAVAAALWSFVHGYITLELANHFTEFDDPVKEVFLQMGVTFCVGLGDDRASSLASHEKALNLSLAR